MNDTQQYIVDAGHIVIQCFLEVSADHQGVGRALALSTGMSL